MRRGLEALRLIWGREVLPEDPISHPQGPFLRGSFLRWLLQPDHLPEDPVPQVRRQGFLAALFGREPLDQDPEVGDRS
jgi:hypothetical protein